jgi:hypothetical protein
MNSLFSFGKSVSLPSFQELPLFQTQNNTGKYSQTAESAAGGLFKDSFNEAYGKASANSNGRYEEKALLTGNNESQADTDYEPAENTRVYPEPRRERPDEFKNQESRSHKEEQATRENSPNHNDSNSSASRAEERNVRHNSDKEENISEKKTDSGERKTEPETEKQVRNTGPSTHPGATENSKSSQQSAETAAAAQSHTTPAAEKKSNTEGKAQTRTLSHDEHSAAAAVQSSTGVIKKKTDKIKLADTATKSADTKQANQDSSPSLSIRQIKSKSGESAEETGKLAENSGASADSGKIKTAGARDSESAGSIQNKPRSFDSGNGHPRIQKKSDKPADDTKTTGNDNIKLKDLKDAGEESTAGKITVPDEPAVSAHEENSAANAKKTSSAGDKNKIPSGDKNKISTEDLKQTYSGNEKAQDKKERGDEKSVADVKIPDMKTKKQTGSGAVESAQDDLPKAEKNISEKSTAPAPETTRAAVSAAENAVKNQTTTASSTKNTSAKNEAQAAGKNDQDNYQDISEILERSGVKIKNISYETKTAEPAETKTTVGKESNQDLLKSLVKDPAFAHRLSAAAEKSAANNTGENSDTAVKQVLTEKIAVSAKESLNSAAASLKNDTSRGGSQKDFSSHNENNNSAPLAESGAAKQSGFHTSELRQPAASQSGSRQEAAAAAQELMSKMQSALRTEHAVESGAKMSLEFETASLGQARMTVQKNGETLSVSIQVSSDSCRDNLNRQRDDMAGQLMKMGYKEVNLSFSSGGDGKGGQSSAKQEQEQGNQNAENVRLPGQDEIFDLSSILGSKA